MKDYMMRRWALFLLILSAFAAARAQPCTGDILLTSQAQVDAFPSQYPCTTFGWLRVSGGDITNVDSLYRVESVGTLLISFNDSLTDLSGLSSLRTITDVGLFIQANSMLTSLDGLSSLEYMSPEDENAQLTISDNFALLDIGALRNLKVAGTVKLINNSILSLEGLSSLRSAISLEINGNPGLTNLNGLEGLTQLSEYLARALTISSNASLVDLHGLDNITRTGGTITISNNASLVTVDGLNSLSHMAGEDVNLTISGNPKLTNLDGLSSLTAIGNSGQGINNSGRIVLTISNNSSLANIDGLSSLTALKGQVKNTITVTNNPNLAVCCGLYMALANINKYCSPFIANCGQTTISGNGSQCTQNYILSWCIPDELKCTGRIILDTQQEVDEFNDTRGCTVIADTLTVSGNAILNLNGLSNLTEVGHLAVHSCNRIQSLSGLDNISKVGNLQVSVSTMRNLDELSSLTAVNGFLKIFSNPHITDLSGLNGVSEVGGTLEIFDNPNLGTLVGLTNMRTIGGDLILQKNRNLNNIDELNLESIGGRLDILNNAELNNLDGLASLDSIGHDSQSRSLRVESNPNLKWCCGLYDLLHDTRFGGSVSVINNDSTCTTEEIELGGPCCQEGSQLPLDKSVEAEQAWGFAPHTTNVLVHDFEPGILYELRNNVNNYPVVGPVPGDIGLFVKGVTETTGYNVLARNTDNNCKAIMSTLPTITILKEPSECTSVPGDQELYAENNPVAPGEATNILVLQGEAGVVYALRSDTDDAWVAGPYPSSVGLNTGPLSSNTTFNVLAIDEQTHCTAEMSMKVTVTVTENVSAPLARVRSQQNVARAEGEKELNPHVALYPNPNNGKFDVEVENDYLGLYYLTIHDLSGRVMKQQILSKEGKVMRAKVDMSQASKGIYFLSIYGNGRRSTRKVAITD